MRRVAFNEAHNSTRRARRWLVALARHGPPADVPVGGGRPVRVVATTTRGA